MEDVANTRVKLGNEKIQDSLDQSLETYSIEQALQHI